MSLSWNHKLFLKINSQVGKRKWLDKLMHFIAHWLIFILGASVILWGILVFEPIVFKQYVKLLLTAVAFGIVASWLTACFVQEHRPITEFPNIKLLVRTYQKWKSFPSDHAMIAMLFALISILAGAPVWLGLIFVFIALLIGSSRIYVGVHYPADVLGGIFYAIVFSLLSFWLLGNVTQPLYNLLFR